VIRATYWVLWAGEAVFLAVLWHEWGWQSAVISTLLCMVEGTRIEVGRQIKALRLSERAR
jgi:hypothetical protein